jgi:hypothetical protein
MKIKVTVKYHIEVGNEVIECESLEQAERKLKHLSEVEKFLIKTELNGDKVLNQYLIG